MFTSDAKPFESEVYSRYGAPMGRRSDAGLTGKVRLQRVPYVDGDYDPGGAYWGYVPGLPLWCAWNDEGTRYLRAPSRTAAKAQLVGCTFYR